MVIDVPIEPVSLRGLAVEAGPRCEVRPEEGRATARVWEEVRKALAAEAWTREAALYTYMLQRFERTLDRDAEKVESTTEPITEARVDAMTSRGENPFWGLMVPDAAVRLKQGIGRLIRTRTDRGVVLLLDDRLLTKRYGRTIREALPPMPLVRGPWRVVREKVAEFYS
jgi:hypothetical protein